MHARDPAILRQETGNEDVFHPGDFEPVNFQSERPHDARAGHESVMNGSLAGMPAGGPNQVKIPVPVLPESLAAAPRVQLVQCFGRFLCVQFDEAFVGHAVAADDGISKVEVRGGVVANRGRAGVTRRDGSAASSESAPVENEDPRAPFGGMNGGLTSGPA